MTTLLRRQVLVLGSVVIPLFAVQIPVAKLSSIEKQCRDGNLKERKGL